MAKLTLEKIIKLQNANNLKELQENINTGLCWRLEGYYGRLASNLLESGACYLPETRVKDAYGNTVPSRNDLQDGTKGTLGNSINFWQRFEDGDIDVIEYVESLSE